jgi:transcriptional regulator with XRE-family HTH domain
MDDENRINERVGRNIRKLRVLAGWTQTDLAGWLGLTFQQVQKYERGQNRVSAATLFRLRQFFACNYADFFADPDDTNAPLAAVPSERQRRTMQWCRAFTALDEPLRERVLALVQTLVRRS